MPGIVGEIRTLLESPFDVEISVDSQWPSFHADRTLLRQILQNLISNAIKFNQRTPKRITIGWQPAPEDGIELFVRDNSASVLHLNIGNKSSGFSNACTPSGSMKAPASDWPSFARPPTNSADPCGWCPNRRPAQPFFVRLHGEDGSPLTGEIPLVVPRPHQRDGGRCRHPWPLTV